MDSLAPLRYPLYIGGGVEIFFEGAFLFLWNHIFTKKTIQTTTAFHTAKRIWDRSIVSSINPKFDNRFFVILFDIQNYQNKFATCRKDINPQITCRQILAKLNKLWICLVFLTDVSIQEVSRENSLQKK